MLRVELQASVLTNQRLAHVIQRFYRFLNWTDCLSSDADNWLPVRADVSRLLGFSADEFLTAAFVVISQILQIRNARDLMVNPPYIGRAKIGSFLTNSKALESWIDLFTCDLASLEYSESEPSFSVADLKPLIERPLLSVGDDRVFCPLPSLLEDTLNTRFFFLLFDAYQAADGGQAAKRFSRLQGDFLEHYVYELIADLAAPDYRIFGEITYPSPYGNRKSTDVVAIRPADQSAVFVEVTKTRFRLFESIFEMDEAAVEIDVDNMVVRKAKQIQERIDDLAAGFYHFEVPVSRIAPLIVTGQGVPGLLALREIIEAKLQRNGWLQATEPLLWCDIEELEGLALAGAGSVDLFELLYEKAHHKDKLARLQGLKNYLYYYRPKLIQKSSASETVFPQFDELRDTVLRPTLREWGLPVPFSKETT
jgi:hypothetical protein